MSEPCPLNAPHHHQSLSENCWIAHARRLLRLDGFRLTSSRLAFLAWVASQDFPFTAEEAFNTHNQRFSRCSRSTIYRLLNLLRDERLLARVSIAQTDHAFLRKLQGHHAVICLRCRYSVLIGGRDLDAAIAPSMAGSGFSIQRQELSVYGLCSKCRQAPTPS